MPKVTFEGETHQEIIAQVRRWLASAEADEEGAISAQQAVAAGADLTKDALRIVAAAAPRSIAQNDLVKALTDMGYKATDATRDRLVEGLDNVEELTGGSVVRTVRDKGRDTVFEMNAAIAKQILRSLSG
jgi:hypothetical protein